MACSSERQHAAALTTPLAAPAAASTPKATPATPLGAFRVSIQSKATPSSSSSSNVARSVSFHHHQQPTARRSAYNEWLHPYQQHFQLVSHYAVKTTLISSKHWL